MWSCQQCATLYKGMKDAIRLVDEAFHENGPSIDCDPFNMVPSTQIQLAEHLAKEHTADLPPPDPACERCAEDSGGRRPEPLRLQHRARHVFAPPSTAGGL